MKKYKSVTDPTYKRDEGTLGTSGKDKFPGAQSVTPHIWEKTEMVVITKLKRSKKKED
jgi:hypothetical protein